MKIEMYDDNYKVIDSGVVILHRYDSELKFSIKASETFSFDLILKFFTNDIKEATINKKVNDNKIIFECVNFNGQNGVGPVEPVSIATVSGKELLFCFWSYSMSDRSVRKIEYTFFEEE